MFRVILKSLKVIVICALLLSMISFTPTPEVYAADEYDDLRLKYRNKLIGGTYDSNDPYIIDKLRDIENETEKYWNVMNSNHIWDDLEGQSLTEPRAIDHAYLRLKAMSIGWATEGS